MVSVSSVHTGGTLVVMGTSTAEIAVALITARNDSATLVSSWTWATGVGVGDAICSSSATRCAVTSVASPSGHAHPWAVGDAHVSALTGSTSPVVAV